MLRNFPRVRRRVEVEDVLQNVAIRLLRALQSVRPANLRRLCGLAALQVRRELIDLARRFQDWEGPGTSDAGKLPEDTFEEKGELKRWAAFHEAVERLPAQEREMVSLAFYHGWHQRVTWRR